MNPTLALFAMLAMPILAYRASIFGARYRPLSVEIQQQLAVLTTRLEQNLRGARIVKAFAQEDAEIDRFETENQKWFGLAAATARLTALNIPLLDLISNLATVVIIWFGGLLVIRGELTLGEMVAFITYLAQLTSPIRRLGFLIPSIAMAGASAERVFEILDEKTQVEDAEDATQLGHIRGHLRFDNVSFSYARPHNVLRDVSFEIEPGQILALLGPTGSGKSSIINMIPRFYDPTEGRILLDGHDIRTATLHSLRSQIGIVLQESTLFATTIRENIAFGRPDATEEEIVEAAHAAQAHEFIESFPDGYDTKVGERGRDLVRRAETEGSHRPNFADRSTHSHSRRCHLKRGYPDRAPDPEGSDESDEGTHFCHHRPASQHRALGRPDYDVGKGANRSCRQT